MAFCGDVVTLSVSYGPADTKLAFYKSPLHATSGFAVPLPGGMATEGFVLNGTNHLHTLHAPAGAQNLAWNGRNLLVAFEGGSKVYRERWRGWNAGIEDRCHILRVPGVDELVALERNRQPVLDTLQRGYRAAKWLF